MKRLLKNVCVGLVVALGLLSVTTPALAEVDGNWEFSYSDANSTATITGYSGSSTIVTVPSSVSRTVSYQEKGEDGEYHTHYRTYTYTVTAIASRAFRNKTSLTSVTIPSFVTSIGTEVFSGCTGLKSVAIHANITGIPASLFSGCSSLSSVSFPSSVGSIGDSAFSGCSSLSTPPLSGIKSIGNSAFANCSSFPSVILGPQITSLGSSAFQRCTGITNLTVDCTLSSLPNYLFNGCSGLVSVTIGDNVKGLGNNQAPHPFGECANIKEFSLGKGITSIPPYYFGTGYSSYAVFAKGLRTVTLLDTVTSIGYSAFSGCTNLADFSIPASVTSIGDGAFSGCAKAFAGNLELGPQITSLGSSAFQGCTGITNVSIKCSLATIPRSLLYECSRLKEVTIPASVTKIDSSAFQYCSSLSHVWFKGAPPTTGSYVFSSVAAGARGHYPRSLADKWLPQIGADGKWNGLVMHELSQPVLRVESANPSAGSLKLAWDDAGDLPGGTTYAVYRSTAETWTEDDRVAAVTGTTWSDNGYWHAEPVLSPLNYWVVAENDHFDIPESNRVETRRRHGILVGLGNWAEEYRQRLADEAASDDVTAQNVLESLPGAENVNDVWNNAVLRGGFANGNIRRLVDSGAKCGDIDAAFADVASNAIPGDICLFYVSTHGGILKNAVGDLPKGTAVLCAYDDDYDEMRLAKAISSLQGISVVCIVSACHSGALFDNAGDSPTLTSWYLANGLAQCSANVGWITAAGGGTSGNGFFDEFLFGYGWDEGWAGSGENVTFLELARYAKGQYDNLFKGFAYEGETDSPEVQIENDGLLSKITAGGRGSHADDIAKPGIPSGLEASQGTEREKINVSWSGADDADDCLVFFRPTGESKYQDFEVTGGASCTITNKCILESSQTNPVRIVVRALNGAGISESAETNGWVSSKRTVTFYCRSGVPKSWRGVEPTEVHESGETEVWGYVSDELEKGSTLGPLPGATREGYTLVSWKNGSEVATGDTLVSDDVRYTAEWTAMTQDWLNVHPVTASAANGDIATAVAMTAANGCNTVGECYELGINPDDPDDDLRIAHFDLLSGKPQLMLNHTVDGSGNSFLPRVRIHGKRSLMDESEDWTDLTEAPNPEAEGYRFFRAGVVFQDE